MTNPAQGRLRQLLNIVVGASLGFLPAVVIILLPIDTLTTSVVIIAWLLTTIVILYAWWGLSDVLTENITRYKNVFLFLVVAYVIGLLALPVGLVATANPDNLFLV